MWLGCIMITDGFYRHHHLSASANHVSVGIDPTSWVHTQWFYDREERQLRSFADTQFCLSVDPIMHVLRFLNASEHDPNGAFIYDDVNSILYWINPITSQHHPVYIDSRRNAISNRLTFFPKVSKNPISKSMCHYIHKFADKRWSNAKKGQSRNRALILMALQRSMPHLTETEYQKYLDMVLGFNKMKFDYFLTDQSEYLLADGHTVTRIQIDSLRKFNYKFYALWHINEKNQLMHFLSGKYLKVFDMESKFSNHTLCDLRLVQYSKEIDDTLVTVQKVPYFDAKYEMYINKNGKRRQLWSELIYF